MLEQAALAGLQCMRGRRSKPFGFFIPSSATPGKLIGVEAGGAAGARRQCGRR